MLRSLLVLLLASPAFAQDVKLPRLLIVEPPKAAASDTEIQKLMKARYAEVWSEMVQMHKAMAAGQGERGGSNSYFNAATRLVTSYMALDPTKDDKLAMLTNYVELAKDYEAMQKARFDSGSLARQELHRATYFRLDAEIQLAKVKESK